MSLPNTQRFLLGRSNRKFLGVCSGLANYFELDVTLIRIAFVLATLLGVGAPLLAYFVVALIAD